MLKVINIAMLLLLSIPIFAREMKFELEQTALLAYEEGMGGVSVAKSATGDGIKLYDSLLIEDDGPGIGAYAEWIKIDKSPIENVAGEVYIKKILNIVDPKAVDARLVLPGGGFGIKFNGRELEAPKNTRYPKIPVELLKAGDNEVILYGKAEKKLTVKIALKKDILLNAPERRDRPARSYKSVDGGKSWKNIDGEYYVRLHLTQYAVEGSFISGVIDLMDEKGKTPEDKAAFSAGGSIKSIEAVTSVSAPKSTEINFVYRTGATPVYKKESWTDWKELKMTFGSNDRYLQWKAVLKTSDQSISPELLSVKLTAVIEAVDPPKWASKLDIVGSNNGILRYTSLPFEYEDPNYEKIAGIRKKYKLDEVVAGSSTEYEKLVKLRNWVAHQWKYDPPGNGYPAWDADEILTRKTGFCVQYAITYMQCAISLGFQTRFLFSNNSGSSHKTGHEFCEVWSNEYNKWIFMDPNQNLNHVNAKTSIPMSLLEVHDLLLKTYYGEEVATWKNGPEESKASEEIATCYGGELKPNKPRKDKGENGGIDGKYFVPFRWLNMRYMPRNNYLSKPYPVPKMQGMSWDWPDYYCWTDKQVLKEEFHYRNFISRRTDLDWTINRVRFDAEYGAYPGTVVIKMGTETPYFKSFLANINGAGWKECGDKLEWKLNSGNNKIEMRTVNTSGVEGPTSYLELKYEK